MQAKNRVELIVLIATSSKEDVLVVQHELIGLDCLEPLNLCQFLFASLQRLLN
jgi:hypothetical protein